MNLERMKQSAISYCTTNDLNHRWAVVSTDGCITYASDMEEAMAIFEDVVSSTEYLTGTTRHDYGLVRVDVESSVSPDVNQSE